MFSELNGKVATVKGPAVWVESLKKWHAPVLYPAEERSLCVVRNHRTSTTVNGVCLPCTLSTKHTPSNTRRKKA